MSQPSQVAHVAQVAQVAHVVLDTNIVLDLFLFQDPRTELLRAGLESKELQWIATPHMRNELERVLTYAHIFAKLSFYKLQSQDILSQFDRFAALHTQPVAKAPYVCKDADDQAFIDLACALSCQSQQASIHLISKDKAVLSMRKRLLNLSVFVRSLKIQ